MIYLLFVIAISVINGINQRIYEKGSKARKYFCFIIFLLLFLFSALRGESVGIDTTHRYLTYQRVQQMSLSSFLSLTSVEPGYAVLVKVCSLICPYPWFGEMVYSAIILGVHMWFMYKYCEELPYTIALFIIFNFSATINTTRQYLAISIVLVAIHFIIKKRFIPSIIITVFSIFFHSSAVICLLLCVLALKNVTINKRRFALLIPVAVVSIVFYNELLNLIFRLLPQYSHYLNLDFYGASSSISIPWVALYIFILGLILFLYPKNTGKLQPNDDYNRFSVVSVVFLLYVVCDVTSFFIKAIYRVMRYFYIGFTIMLPETVKCLVKKDESNRKLFMGAFLILALLIGYIEFKANKYRIFPYVFIWE